MADGRSEKADGRSETGNEKIGNSKDVAKLALKLNRKYTKGSMVLAMATFLQFGDRMPFKNTMMGTLDRTSDIKMSDVRILAKGGLDENE